MNELLNQLKHYFDTTPRKEIERSWSALEKEFGDVGPKIKEFLVYLDKTSYLEHDILQYTQTILETPNSYNSEFFYTFANNIAQ